MTRHLCITPTADRATPAGWERDRDGRLWREGQAPEHVRVQS